MDNVTTGQSSIANNPIDFHTGDIFEVNGVVSPDPNLAAGDLELELWTNNYSQKLATLGVLQGGYYQYGPTPLPASVSSFDIVAVFKPWQVNSDTVKVNVIPSTPPPAGNQQINVKSVDANTQQPLPGASITVGAYGTQTSDSQGNATFNVATNQGYNVEATKSGYQNGGVSIYVTPTQTNFTVGLTPSSGPPPPGTELISEIVTNVTTGQVAGVGGTLQASVGDQITVSGTVLPDPGQCTGCVSIDVTGPTAGNLGAIGIGALGATKYLWGPGPIPASNAGTTFGLQATYGPTGAKSGIVYVNVAPTGGTGGGRGGGGGTGGTTQSALNSVLIIGGIIILIMILLYFVT